MANKPFKMKGSPMKRNFGIGVDSPIKQTTTPSYKGVNIDPSRSYDYKSAKIPSFRDMVSLEQQQAARKAWKAKRADKKLDRQMQSDLKEDSTPENTGKRRDEMYNTVQEQQGKTLESQREMEEEGKRLNPDPLEEHVVNQPLTLPEIEEKKELNRESSEKKPNRESSEKKDVDYSNFNFYRPRDEIK